MPGIDKEPCVCCGGSMVLVIILHLPLVCVNLDKLLNFCEPHFLHIYLLRLCGKEERIHVHMAHSKCSEKVGILMVVIIVIII